MKELNDQAPMHHFAFAVKGKYLDEGFVDEDADVMGKLGKLFGGGKKK